MRITKEIKFEAAHVLSDYKGPCSNLHGHSYTGLVEIEAPVDDENTHMVLDFNKIKEVVDAYDHATIFSDIHIRDNFEDELFDLVHSHNKRYVIIYGNKCTAENMAIQIARDIRKQLKTGGVNVKLKETATSLVESGWIYK